MKGWMGAGMAALVTYACGAGALACGDTIVNTTTVYTDGGGAADGETEAPVGEGDAGARDDVDAGADAGDASPEAACVTSSAEPVSDRCGAIGPCTGCAGGLELYGCEPSDGGTRPDIEGCEPRGTDGGVTHWCCPELKCVRNRDVDTSCLNGEMYLCPLMPGKDYSVPPQTGTKCSDVGINNGVERFWCCSHTPL